MSIPQDVGFVVERKFVEEINDKKYDELNENLKHLIAATFPYLDKNEKIKCCQLDAMIKPDICIYQKDKRCFISIKTGLAECVHTESVFSFVEFLRKHEISEHVIETFLLYHYGDGTTDGSGTTRLGSVETRFKLNDRIKEMNDEFNNSKELIKAFAERVMWQGVDKYTEHADVLYHGDTEYGVFMSRSQFKNFIERRSWKFMEKCVHIGPFVIRPKARYSNSEIKHEQLRKLVKVCYPRLIHDTTYLCKLYNN